MHLKERHQPEAQSLEDTRFRNSTAVADMFHSEAVCVWKHPAFSLSRLYLFNVTPARVWLCATWDVYEMFPQTAHCSRHSGRQGGRSSTLITPSICPVNALRLREVRETSRIRKRKLCSVRAAYRPAHSQGLRQDATETEVSVASTPGAPMGSTVTTVLE